MHRYTTIILFGITGDLAQKKILPALYDLYKKKMLGNVRIVGFSRRDMSDAEVRSFVAGVLPGQAGYIADGFLNMITYVQGEFDDSDAYRRLADHLATLDRRFHDGCSDKLFYLSVPPTLYEMIATHISASGLSIPCGGEDGFARILVEKPFGKDLATAERLDELFGRLFKEEQIFRIDHYLAKDALHQMTRRRRTDRVLAAKWNNKYIERVELNLFETAAVGNRGAFYDGVGALRDVGQNHMLQMLALVAMDVIDGHHRGPEIQAQRAAVLEKIIPLSPQEIASSFIGQYVGYLSEPGVAGDSTTETFFSLVARADTPSFSGVPFVFTSGKALDRNLTDIRVSFKDGSHEIFSVPPEDSLPAYERILLDCINGDQTVFTSTAEVIAEWQFITPIVRGWESISPVVYEKGADAESILDRRHQ